MKRVLVTGSSGAVGPLVIDAFSAAGWHVAALSRSRPHTRDVPPNCEVFVSDLFDEHGLAAAAHGVDVVVHLAGLLHVLNPPKSLAEEYQRVNAEGTRRVVAAARNAGARRIVFASTIAVYGPTHGVVVDESVAPHPDTDYALSKLAAERHVLDGRGDGVVLRLAAVYGGRVKGNYEKLVSALEAGRFLPVGTGSNRRTLVHERDAAAAFVYAADHPELGGGILNVTDGTSHSVAAITEAICRAIGRPTPKWFVPVPAANAAAMGVEAMFALARRQPPVSRRTLAKYLESVEVSGQAFLARGFVPAWPLKRGWQQAVEDLRRLRRP